MGHKRVPFRFPQPTPAQYNRDRRRARLALGRPLQRPEAIHHHSLTALVICQDTAYHYLLHRRTITLRFGYNPNHAYICFLCQRAFPHDEFYQPGGKDAGLHYFCFDCGMYRWDRAVGCSRPVHSALELRRARRPFRISLTASRIHD